MKRHGFGCFMGALLLALASPLWAAEPGEVLIDELYYDAPGPDTGHEYIILYNAAADPVDLDGWRIEWGGMAFTYATYVISGVVILPAEEIVFGGSMMIPVPDVVYDFIFQGGGSSSDGARIVDAAGAVIDTLIYDSPNSNGLPGDGGLDPYPDEMCAVDVPAGKTLTRDADHTDTDDCSADFREGDPLGSCWDDDGDGYSDEACGGDDCDDADSAVNPGVPEICEDGIDDDCDGLVDADDPECSPGQPGDVLIDELFYNPTGQDEGGEYVILYDATEADIDLSSWELQFGSSFSYGKLGLTGITIPARSTFILGEAFVPAPDVVVDFVPGLPNGGSESDGVRIVDASQGVIDTVIYDSPNSNGLPGDGGYDPYPDEMCAPDTGPGLALGRDALHTDTDDCSVDFTVRPPFWCDDVDGDGYVDEACGGEDCDDADPAVNPGAEEVCTGGVDDDCDGLVDSEDPDCAGEHILELVAFYSAPLLSMDFTIGTPEPATWKLYFILTYPAVQIIPAWTIPLPAIDPPADLPIILPFPSVGWVGIYTGLFTAVGAEAVELVWVNTG